MSPPSSCEPKIARLPRPAGFDLGGREPLPRSERYLPQPIITLDRVLGPKPGPNEFRGRHGPALGTTYYFGLLGPRQNGSYSVGEVVRLQPPAFGKSGIQAPLQPTLRVEDPLPVPHQKDHRASRQSTIFRRRAGSVARQARIGNRKRAPGREHRLYHFVGRPRIRSDRPRIRFTPSVRSCGGGGREAIRHFRPTLHGRGRARRPGRCSHPPRLPPASRA